MLLFNTLSRTVEDFTPIHPPAVTYYTCGPTVYHFAHIGNLRTYIVEDLLKRVLLDAGFEVNHLMNITDVGHLTSDADEGEDKLELGAMREHKSVREIADEYTRQFQADLLALNIVPPSVWLKATETITDQIALIQRIETKGATYRISDGIYFDTSTFPNYGKLGRLDLSGLREGARVQKNAEKRHPTDFALWKFSPKNAQRQQEWDSPWGVGFPGWHIECSAMAMKELGETIDLHASGVDHIPVHHTNEIAQSETATGKPFVRTWVHIEHLLIDRHRMGKSEGNAVTVSDLQSRAISPLAFRLFVFGAHYRSPLNFTWEAVTASQAAWTKLADRVALLPHGGKPDQKILSSFRSALQHDLDTPKGMSILWNAAKTLTDNADKRATLEAMDALLGLNIGSAVQITPIPEDILRLAQERENARAAKQFSVADDIRKKIETQGYLVKDTPHGPQIKRKS